MRSKLITAGFLFLGMAAAAGPLRVSAGGDPLASPTPRPTQRVTAPVISGRNPEVLLSEGEQGDITPSDVFPGNVPDINIQLPEFVEPLPIDSTLDYPVLSQTTVDCGPTSLAAAMKIMDGDAELDSERLRFWLADRSLMYDWGTGVEELAFAARNHGYAGSSAFHDWEIPKLIGELDAGRPVVVALGINGEGRPGHFVTLTDISSDGQIFTCLDPGRGSIQLSREEFTALWDRQGKSGVALNRKVLPPETDPLVPWIGLLGAVSILALGLKDAENRIGEGLLRSLRGKLNDPYRRGIGGGVLDPDRKVLASGKSTEVGGVRMMRWVPVKIPIYETRMVKVGLRGIKEQVPVYKTKKVFAGLRKEIRRVPIYQRKKVLTGSRWVEKKIKVTRYRYQKVKIWKKITRKVPGTRWLGRKKIVIGYRQQVSWKRVWQTRKVPYQATKKILVKEPVYQWKRIQTGWRSETRWVPKYQHKQVLTGYKILQRTVPVFEERRVQVGTRTVMRQEYVGGGETGGSGEGETGESGDEEKENNKRLLEKLILDSNCADPPPGYSDTIWKSLSDEEQTRIRKDYLCLLKEQVKNEKLKNNKIYKVYKFIQKLRAGLLKAWKWLGFPDPRVELPHLVSLSANEKIPLNLIQKDGVVLRTYKPPNILGLFVMQQKINIEDKYVLTAYPKGKVDFNLTTGTYTIRIGKMNVFGTVDGFSGYSIRQISKDPQYQERWNKYSFKIGSNGIIIKYILEGVNYHEEYLDGAIKTKNVSSVSCKTTIIRKEALAVISGVFILLYLLLSSGVGVNLQEWPRLLGFPI